MCKIKHILAGGSKQQAKHAVPLSILESALDIYSERSEYG